MTTQNFRKKPVVVEATRWLKNGDHPLDYERDIEDPVSGNTYTSGHRRDNDWEGDVVRYFRRPEPEYAGQTEHEACGRIWHDHGWIDTLEGGHTVCPGDWIITGVQGERYPCKPDIFEQTYEPAGAPRTGVTDRTVGLSSPSSTKVAMLQQMSGPMLLVSSREGAHEFEHRHRGVTLTMDDFRKKPVVVEAGGDPMSDHPDARDPLPPNVRDRITDAIRQHADVVVGHDAVHPDRSDCGGVGGCAMMRAEHDSEVEIVAMLERTARQGYRVVVR